MVETVKHAIVLLQIAKNTSCPGPQDDTAEGIAEVHGAQREVSTFLTVSTPAGTNADTGRHGGGSQGEC